MSDVDARYTKLERFAPVGAEGVQRLNHSSVAVLGCGALGSLAAEQLVRSGVGRVRLIERDFVERSNLQRQVLYTERHADESAPKAVAAAEVLRTFNSGVVVDPQIADFAAESADTLLSDVDLVLDATDNLPTRYLLNEVCLDRALPWVYGGAVGGGGMASLFIPGGVCLRCVFPEPPPAGELQTCDTAGVLASTAHAVASLQTSLAVRCLVGDGAAVANRLAILNVWGLSFRTVGLDGSGPCETCGGGRRPYREGLRGGRADVLCGRDSVQISADPAAAPPDLDAIAGRLASLGDVSRNAYLLRWTPRRGSCRLTLFRDGRSIVHGTSDPAAARAFVARHFGQ